MISIKLLELSVYQPTNSNRQLLTGTGAAHRDANY